MRKAIFYFNKCTYSFYGEYHNNIKIAPFALVNREVHSGINAVNGMHESSNRAILLSIIENKING